MELSTNANCSRCKLRPRAEGGNGNCPKVGVHRDIYVKRGEDNGCTTFDPREYVPVKVQRELKHNPQEAALF